MATSDDCREETTEGARLDKSTQLMHKYMDKVMLLSVHQPHFFKILLEVIYMLKLPEALFSPGIISGVLKQMIKAKFNANNSRDLFSTSTKVVSQ